MERSSSTGLNHWL
jgi:hypothetical protein